MTARMGSWVLVPGQPCLARPCLFPALRRASTAPSCCLWWLLAPTDQRSNPNGHWWGGGSKGGGGHWGGCSLRNGHVCLALGSPEQDAAEGEDHLPPPASCAPLAWDSPLVPGPQLDLVPLVSTLRAQPFSGFSVCLPVCSGSPCLFSFSMRARGARRLVLLGPSSPSRTVQVPKPRFLGHKCAKWLSLDPPCLYMGQPQSVPPFPHLSLCNCNKA